MAASLHLLHPQTPAIAGFLRVGHTGHKKLADLHAAGRLPFRRAVFDASHVMEQIELLNAFRASGCEIVLDPNFAEMAAVGRFNSSSLQSLPWANPERPWTAEDFGRGRNNDAAKAIAEFAVKLGVNVVLAPSHLIERHEDAWRTIDLQMCEALRHELNRSGGSGIAIDFQLITTSALLKDSLSRGVLAAHVAELPIENVWLRTSGFGATATGAGTRHFVESVRALHNIGRPLIADSTGGFAGLAVAAFGGVGGLSHGVCQKESFRAGDWKTPPSGGGGSATRAYVHELDRYFTEPQLTAIFDAPGGRSRFACRDTSCCPHGGEDMLENAHAHFITQRSRQFDDLSKVPEARREEHFLLRHLDPAVRSARHGVRLKISDGKVTAVVREAKGRLVRMRDALADLHAKGPAPTRSRSPGFRGGARAISAVLGR
jgi:hypothetical protein